MSVREYMQGHDTYSRQTPDGMRARRWRCAECGGTVSMLPSCMVRWRR
ncbi:MAG: hypothetical protein OXH99_10520 [Bryobacterales bacterium]|nr:hypothetical protein [Bryobacterales bacterium]